MSKLIRRWVYECRARRYGRAEMREKVLAMWAYQTNDDYHPLTCPHRGDGYHLSVFGGDIGVLVPTVRGLECPSCGYREWFLW